MARWIVDRVRKSPGIGQPRLLELARKQFGKSNGKRPPAGHAAIELALWQGSIQSAELHGAVRLYPAGPDPSTYPEPADIPDAVLIPRRIREYVTAHPNCTRVELIAYVTGTSTKKVETVIGHIQRMADAGDIRQTSAEKHHTYTMVTK